MEQHASQRVWKEHRELGMVTILGRLKVEEM
jgi:hypothetical protein